MTKEECLNHMQSLGYVCYLEDGCIMVKVDHPLNIEEHRALEKVFKDIGYNATWGWRVFKEGDG